MERSRAATRTMRSLCELLQERDVGIVFEADIRNAEVLQRHAARSHAERPPRVALGVHARGFEHVGMHHTAAEYLDPACLLAGGAAGAVAYAARDVHFGRRFGEGKEARAKSRDRLAEESIGEVGERRLEVDK